jgi:hypothetical protein
MEDEEAIDWRKRFPTFHWTRRTSSRRGDRRFTKMRDIVCGFLCRRRRRRRMREILSFYVWKSVVHGKKGVQTKSMKGSYG